MFQLDHVEVFVPDRGEAAAWYGQVFGMTSVAKGEAWARDPSGPLMISADDGVTMLALFQRAPNNQAPPGGWHRVAFRVGGNEFNSLVDHLRALGIKDEHAGELSIQDHDLAVSVYFTDPWGHRLEVTTYEHEVARQTHFE